MRELAGLFLLVACAQPPERADDRKLAVDDALAEPPPHYADHSGVAPDELAPREQPAVDLADAGADAATAGAEQCAMSEPPLPAPPRVVRSGPPITNYIPPEIIMRPIRARASCFRGCYRAGLGQNPKLAGRVVTRFVIDTDGWVRRARVVENELGDANAGDCIRRAFVGLYYPAPDGGEVTVIYPLVFQP